MVMIDVLFSFFSQTSACTRGAVDFSVFVCGATGRFKTALAALIQQHFGADFAARRRKRIAARRLFMALQPHSSLQRSTVRNDEPIR